MRISQLLALKRLEIIKVAPSASVASAVELMASERVGAVLVIDAEGQLRGVLSERDVVHGLASDPVGLLNRRVMEVATTGGPVASPEDSVQKVMELMTVTRARHVPVLQYGDVIGIVSIGDIVKSRLDEKTRENTVLQEIARSQFFAH